MNAHTGGFRVPPNFLRELQAEFALIKRPSNEDADRSDKALVELAGAAQLIRMAGAVLKGTKHFAYAYELGQLAEMIEYDLETTTPPTEATD